MTPEQLEALIKALSKSVETLQAKQAKDKERDDWRWSPKMMDYLYQR